MNEVIISAIGLSESRRLLLWYGPYEDILKAAMTQGDITVVMVNEPDKKALIARLSEITPDTA